MENIMTKKRAVLCLIVILTVVLAAGAEMFWLSRRKTVKEYKESQTTFGNPLMGYAINAWYNDVSEDISLLYADITWAELEPEEGVYAWEAIEEKNQFARWKKEGKHLVLRFVCDIPGNTEHMDIPEWLYEKSGKAGKWYDGEYGKGFAPDYENSTIISCHEQAVKALGARFGQDGLISYIELGSLGHWGEWHVNYGEGIQRIPGEEIREKYILPWIEAFPDAMILMRRPFAAAKKYGFGLYNDMTGHPQGTQSWFDWINNGGDYDQTGEKNAIVSMKDFWKTAPSGGEFTSSLSMEELMDTNLSETVELIREAHTTFLGPKIPDEDYADGYKEVLKNMGYRLWISRAEIKSTRNSSHLELTWENSGVAPLYKDWPVYVYIEDDTGKLVEKRKIPMEISSVLPGEKKVTSIMLETDRLNSLLEKGYRFAVGIEDPMTETPSVRFAMEVLYKEGKNYLWQ